MSEQGDPIRDWFLSLPLAWQEGIWTAVEGGAFQGDLAFRNQSEPTVCVFFVHKDFAADIVQAIERKNRRSQHDTGASHAN